MQSILRLGLAVPLLAALFAPACKRGGDDDVNDAAVAAVTATALATAPTVVSPPSATTPVAVAPVRAVPPKSDAGAPAVLGSLVDAGALLDAAALLDAGKVIDAGAVLDAGTAANGTLKACFDKCQSVVVGCATPQLSKDGGLPTFKDPAACAAAAEACRAACTL